MSIKANVEEILEDIKKYLDKCVSLSKAGYLLEKENGYILSHKGLMLFNDFISNFIGD